MLSAMIFVIFFVVDAEDTASGDPTFAFCGHEFSYSVLADKFEIFDFTHSVFCPVACIEVFEPLARELRTMAAEAARAFAADAQAAMRAGSILSKANAAEAGVFLTQVCSADAAVHPAWGDEVLGDPPLH